MSIFSKKSLGIDIGASSIKLVEISSLGKKKKLENYLEFQLPINNTSLKTFYGKDLLLLSDEVADLLQIILKKVNIKQKKVAFSLPDFSTFFTTFSLPAMTEQEVDGAIAFEARHHIPLPLSEVTFDWQVIEKQEVSPGVKLKVLLVAIPNKVLESYQRMATLCKLEIIGMEAEVFSLIRSSINKDDTKPICLVDFGWQSTTISIIEKKSLQTSHSFDISGTSLTQALSSGLNVDFAKAEALKKRYGLDPQKKGVSRTLLEKLNALTSEIERICQGFYRNANQQVENVILAGGTALLFGLKEYLSKKMRKNVQIAEPFSNVSFPPTLANRLQELGPSFAVAAGTAMMEVENE